MPFHKNINHNLKILYSTSKIPYGIPSGCYYLLMRNIFFTIFAFISPILIAQENISDYNSSLLKIENKNEEKLTEKNDKLEFNKALKKGNTYYKNKRYNNAISEYKLSLRYLSGDSQLNKKHLGEVYTKIAESYKRLKNRKKTAYFYKKSLDIFTLLKNKKLMARTFNTLAEAERYLGNLVMALNYSTRSLEIHETINDPTGHAKALMGAGIIYRNIGRYEKSLKHIHKAYLYYKKELNYNGIGKTSNEMGNLYIHLEQFEQAKYFFQETINIPEEKLELKTLASALREMAVINYNHTNYESAMFAAKRAYKIYKINNEELKMSLTARIIANIYREQQDNINAIDFYRKSLAIAIKNKSKRYQIKAQTPLAAILIFQDIDEAITLLLSSLEIALKMKDDGQIVYAYRTLRQAEDYRGNFQKALSYAKREIALAKIIQKKTEDKKLTLAKANLHSHKMEIELESLRERTKLDKLELIKKNNEIEIAKQVSIINELELTKNKYASAALAFLLVTCIFLVLLIYKSFINSKKRNKELDYLASRDSLTNCYNRRSLLNIMDDYFSSVSSNDQYCILMVDIDHFKSVNDTHGHGTGDTVIRGFASILQSCIRKNDVVARIGGEEFCIVLHQTSETQAITIAESMRHKVEHSVFDDVNVTSSFGVTSLKFGAKTPLELIGQADLALYQSKSLGRNRVTLWDESLSDA